MLNANLENLIERAEELSHATGNCGRSIRRYLDGIFTEGLGKIVLAGSPEQSGIKDKPLAFAYVVDRILASLKLATSASEGTLEFKLGEVSLEKGSVDVLIEAEVPDSVRDRQEFLATLAFSLRRINGMLAMQGNRLEQSDSALLAEMFYESSTSEIEGHLQQFYALLKNEYALFDSTPIALIGLASLISPAVSDYDKQFDEILDTL
ncbi:filamentous hemagglutinin [Novimethylophilus kurashikiensis]|uniref:Filamentous hemagglutinin n=1 Tax=Novimethylophilus kurashikiensis TaxID=1825523 RepID=A0A2R5FCF6_9PROT|nr:hypothetical protein [Novimethylophilus kurashikiensis]GBG14324.1 filamentous hemagglutinin [Novimethylophilus kurashikiensis]